MHHVTIDLSNVDWTLLRKQKLILLKTIQSITKPGLSGRAEFLHGIMHLLDHIQDQAAETLGEEAVFGKKHA